MAFFPTFFSHRISPDTKSIKLSLPRHPAVEEAALAHASPQINHLTLAMARVLRSSWKSLSLSLRGFDRRQQELTARRGQMF